MTNAAAESTRTVVLYAFEVDHCPLLFLPVSYDGALTELPPDEVQMRAVEAAWNEHNIVDNLDDKLPAEVVPLLRHVWEKPYPDRVGIRLARDAEEQDWQAARQSFLEHKQQHPEQSADGPDGWWDDYALVAWVHPEDWEKKWREARKPAVFTLLLDGRLVYTMAIPAGPSGRQLTNAEIARWSETELTDLLRTVFRKLAPKLCRLGRISPVQLASWERNPARFSFRRGTQSEWEAASRA